MKRRLIGSLHCAAVLLSFCSTSLRATPVTVTMFDASNSQPIAGAVVSRIAAGEEPNEATEVGRSDAAGRLALEIDLAERTGFRVVSPGRSALFGFWGAAPKTREVRLTSTVQWSGRVFDDRGKPAANTRVELVDEFVNVAPFPWLAPLPLSMIRATTTDAAGRFVFDIDPAAAGPIRLRSHDAKGAFVERPIFAQRARATLADGTFELHLADPGSPRDKFPWRATTRPAGPTLSIHLNVLDDATGQPIRDVTVAPAAGTSPDQGILSDARNALRFVDEPIEWSFYDNGWAYALLAKAEGYAPSATRVVKASERSATVELRLKKSSPHTLTLTDPAGAPAAGAKIYLATPFHPAGVPLLPNSYDELPDVVADARGVATIDLPAGPCRAAVMHEKGWAEIDFTKGDIAKRSARLDAWASLTIQVGDGGSNREGDVQTQTGYSQDADCLINWEARGELDATGMFTQPHCRPGTLMPMVQAADQNERADWAYFEVRCRDVEPGEQRSMRVMDGVGRFHATLAESPGQKWEIATLRMIRGPSTKPTTRPAASQAAATRPAAERGYIVGMIYVRPTSTGEIGVTGLSPGVYELHANASDAAVHREFEIADDRPIELGTLGPDAPTKAAFAIGDVAPELKSAMLDGQPFDLAALRGKWVLLDFWGTWCGFCVAEGPTYRDAFEGWGVDGRLTMVSLAVNDTADTVREHLKTHELPWTHVILGDLKSTDVPKRFGVEGYPEVMLISPEGRLVETELRGGSVRAALIKHLGPPSPPRK